ncbi:GNAT family N-acetyltransferase [Agaricicola taiwanensis]|uniref:GNAT family N-acetyltransferase n=1 Tax=Agaricicola taiwanensis TaxID=591372 RepID=UPI001664AAEC|nr:GNAT family N-acetyltransferase [Agaricicola taiwanensis]
MVRPLNVSHSIAVLTRTAFESAPDAFVKIARDVPGEYWRREHFEVDLPKKWELSRAVWQEKSLIGYAIVSSKAPKRAHLHHFMVDGGWRGRGIGSELLTQVLEAARAAGHDHITLKVLAGVPARRLYERSGFVPCGEENGYLVYRRGLP